MILVADIHLRRTVPRARKDDYLAAQERKFLTICDAAVSSPPLVIAGDLFHTARPGDYLEQFVITAFRDRGIRAVLVPGQHDLPYHSYDYIDDSGVGVLQAAGVVDLVWDGCVEVGDHRICGCGYGVGLERLVVMLAQPSKLPIVAVAHRMVVESAELWPGQVTEVGGALLRKMPQAACILNGDNHQSFMVSTGEGVHKRFMVNPGSMMRMDKDQATHKPCYFRVGFGLCSVVERFSLPIEQDVFVNERGGPTTVARSELDEFISKLANGYELGLSFEANLEEFLVSNNIDSAVRDIVWRAVHGDN